MTSFIALNSIKKTYRGKNKEIQVLGGIDLNIKKNEFVSIVGHSGCGKTTLLKILGGILPPSSGQVFINNEHPDKAVDRHNLSFVFQDSSLLPWRTAYSNIKLASEITGIKHENKVEKLINEVGLGEFKDLFPFELSRGMRSRISIVMALSVEPLLLLMDEPFAHLDEITRSKMNEMLLNVLYDIKTTVVFITHNISEAVFLSDRVIVLTNLPAVVTADVPVDFARPRTNNLRFDPGFWTKVKEIQNFLGGTS